MTVSHPYVGNEFLIVYAGNGYVEVRHERLVTGNELGNP